MICHGSKKGGLKPPFISYIIQNWNFVEKCAVDFCNSLLILGIIDYFETAWPKIEQVFYFVPLILEDRRVTP